MIVIDASALFDFLIGAEATTIAHMLAKNTCAVPHLLDVEIAQVLRKFVRMGAVTETRADEVLEDLSDLRLKRYAHGPLLPRAFKLRNNVTVYDGVYLALAEALGAELITRDAALENVPGCLAKVTVVA